MEQHFNVDITIAAKNGANPTDIEDAIRDKLEADTPEDIIHDIDMIGKIEEVEQ